MGRVVLSPLLFGFLLASPIEVSVDPGPGDVFTAVFTGPASDAPSGEFRGSIALNGSPIPMPITGRAERRGGRLRVRANLRYADVPSDWTNRFRADSFDYQLRGEVGGSSPVSWEGTLSWRDVGVEGDRAALARFLKLTSFEVTSLSLRRSEGRAVLRVRNPFSFPIRIASSKYELRVIGRSMGGGESRGRLVRARRDNGLELPFAVNYRDFLAALGGAVMSGRPVDGELRGFLMVRLPTGDVRVPLDLAGPLGTDGARSGVFALPEGGTGLSPHR